MTGSRILVVDDETDIRNLIQEILTEEGYDVVTAANATDARRAVRERSPDLVLLDIWMPDTDGISLLGEWRREHRFAGPVIILSGHGTVETAVEATRLGAVDFIEKPLSLNRLLGAVEQALAAGRSGGHVLAARALLPPVFAALGRSRRMGELREKAVRLARYGTPLLVIGEPGSGRGSLARFIHDSSERRDRPYVAVAGASLTAASAADLLLGVDAAGVVEAGCFERAQGGTVYISNIEEASPAAQALLAGILETGGYTPRGRAALQPLAARIITSLRPATLADPAAAGLRPDLVERLGGQRLSMPPLRDYVEDMPDLLRYLVEDLADREQLPYRRFGFAAQNRLRNYPWPGNLEQLRGLVRRLLAAGGSPELSLEEVERELSPVEGNTGLPVGPDLLAMPLREAREHFERAYLTEQLALCDGKVGALARRVGMERTHLYRKLRTLGVEFRSVPGEEP